MTETSAADAPRGEDAEERTEKTVDELLADYEESSSDKSSQPEKSEVKGDPRLDDVVGYIEAERQQKSKQWTENTLSEAAKAMSEAVEGVSEDTLRSVLVGEVVQDTKAQNLWKKLQADPTNHKEAWETYVRGIAKAKFGASEQESKPDISASRQAARAAVRANSGAQHSDNDVYSIRGKSDAEIIRMSDRLGRDNARLKAS